MQLKPKLKLQTVCNTFKFFNAHKVYNHCYNIFLNLPNQSEQHINYTPLYRYILKLYK